MGAGSGAATGAAIGSFGGPIGTVIGAGIGATAGLFGGKHQADAQVKAAEIQAKSQADAARQQAEAAAQTLAFEKQQASVRRADDIAAQQANYGQWGYRQNAIRPFQGSGLAANNTLAQLLGLPAQNTQLPDIPAAPQFQNLGDIAGVPQNAVGGPVDGSGASISAYLKTHGGDISETPYWVQKWPELVARGKEIGQPNYPMTRLAAADSILKAQPQNLGRLAGVPMPPLPLGPGQQLPLIPGSLGSLAMA